MSAQAWDWLGEPLAHDLANTVHWRGTTPVDHIADPAGLRSWLEHAPHPLPPVQQVDDRLVQQVRRLRDAVREAMRAVADGDAPRREHIRVIDETAQHHPMVRRLDPDDLGVQLRQARRAAHPLLGTLAQAAVETLGDAQHRERIAFCAAPGCGGLYERERPNQVWCDPHCGARARAERHHQKSS